MMKYKGIVFENEKAKIHVEPALVVGFEGSYKVSIRVKKGWVLFVPRYWFSTRYSVYKYFTDLNEGIEEAKKVIENYTDKEKGNTELMKYCFNIKLIKG